ncbi:MAG: acetate--CoA ligase family protein [Desulfobacterales bacterium]
MNQKIKISLENFKVSGYPDEFETKALLSSFGIPVPRGIRILPGEKPDSEKLVFPVVVKVCSAHILHKTDQNGVIIGVEPDKIEETLQEFEKRFPDTPILVEEQIHFRGPELIVGAMVDPDFGPAVMVGAGGILTELYKDVSFRLAPLTVREAGRMIRELIVSPAFFGYRGLKCDPEWLAQIITSTAELAVGFGKHFSQLDINPLVFSKNRWVALDAKLLLNQENKNPVHNPVKKRRSLKSGVRKTKFSPNPNTHKSSIAPKSPIP